MPTASGKETIGERVTRLKARLEKVRAALERSIEKGSSFSVNGTSISQVQYERLSKEEAQLEEQLNQLYARLEGGRVQPGLATTKTVVYRDE